MVKILHSMYSTTMASNEKNGLTVSTWGPVGWLYIHSVSFGFPIDPSKFDIDQGNPVGTTENNYRMFFKYVGKTLPCRYCRESYDKFFEEIPIRLESRDSLTEWVWEMHNRVNNKLEKTYSDSDFDLVKKKYESFRAKCSPSLNSKGCTEPVDNEPKKICKIVIRPVRTMKCTTNFVKYMILLAAMIISTVIYLKR